MLRLAASRRGGPETRSGTVQSLKCCPCQQKAARLQSAAPGSMERGGPETRSGTVQSLKCCPCQQKRGSIEGAGTVQSLKCCPCQQKQAARLERGSKVMCLEQRGGGPRNALGHRPASRNEPRGSKETRKCSIEGGGPETRSGTVQSLKCCPCQQKRAARLQSASMISLNFLKKA